jgi:pyruvate dehydrogenase E2 component (dihydrolipoamide acetyltransferase)
VALVALEIPKIGLVMENARIVRWLKDVGDVVRQGEPLLELETEKSVVEVESTESGRLVELLLRADQEARVGDRIAWLENDADVSREGKAERIKSSPVARRLAAQHAVDLRGITGTGPHGRVQLIDVQRTVETQAAHSTAVSTPSGVQPLSSMRRALARSMTLSNANVPQFAVERAVDWTTLQTLRAKLVAELPAGTPQPSVNDFLLQGIAGALLRFPALNVTFAGDANSPDAAVLAAQGVHIGLIVAVDQGLLVPVFHGVERLGLQELARLRKDILQRALQGKLRREELDGATFSVSNLGKGGPDLSAAIGHSRSGPPARLRRRPQRQHSCQTHVPAHTHGRSPRCRWPPRL